MKVESERSQGKWKARRQVSRIHVKENFKMIWIFVHIPMYVVLEVKPAFIHDQGFKSCVYEFTHVFRDGQGNIKGQKMVHGI